MARLPLTVLSLRYSSWSIRPWLVLTHAGAEFTTSSVELEFMRGQNNGIDSLESRRALGSIHGLFPALAICEYAAEAFPGARLWPEDPIERALARAFSAEMHSGFTSLRNEMPCHIFATAPALEPSEGAKQNIERVFEIWSECLDRSGGPFLFGDFGIVDAMYLPVLTRFRTYGIELPPSLEPYGRELDSLPATRRLLETALGEPRVPIYDEYVVSLGGDPEGNLLKKD